MHAVIKTGGKQYHIQEKDVLKIEKRAGEVGQDLVFDKVLLISDDKMGNVKIGEPYLEGAKVSSKILEQGRAKKVKVVKYKPKTRYKRTAGHRQLFTKVEITKIEG